MVPKMNNIQGVVTKVNYFFLLVQLKERIVGWKKKLRKVKELKNL
jgi:hypothetical protein